VLQGEGGSVDQLLRQTADLTGFLADRDKLFQQVATNLTPVLVDLAGQGTELRTAVSELGKLMSGLARNRHRFGAALDGVIRLVTTTSSLVHQARAPTVRDIKAFRSVAAMYAEHSQLYGQSLPSLGKLLGTLARTFSYKGALNSYLCSLDATIGGVKVGSTSTPPKYSKVCR
jgi:phospholipid/cholesterol/gamma-HCH transport system substrate-binding protein